MARGGGADEEADLAGWVRRDRSERVVDRGEHFPTVLEYLRNQAQVQPHALALVAHDGAGTHRPAQRHVEVSGEERLGRAHRIRRVHDHHVIYAQLVLDELRRVCMDEREPLVVEGGGRRGAEVALGDGHHERIQLAHRDALHARVPAHLAQHAAVTAADDQHILRVRVAVHGDLCDHLLVGVLVAFGDLDHTVEHEHRAVRRRAEDEHILEVGAALVEHLLDLEHHGLPRPHDLGLGKPAILQRWACPGGWEESRGSLVGSCGHRTLIGIVGRCRSSRCRSTWKKCSSVP